MTASEWTTEVAGLRVVASSDEDGPYVHLLDADDEAVLSVAGALALADALRAAAAAAEENTA